MTRLLTLFFLSGATGLAYQVLWTRVLTLTFGHTVLAVSLVLTLFMAGLALGSVVAGRARTTIRHYALLELFIGGWALASLPLLEQVTTYLQAALVLLPPTTAMGATLPIVTRALHHDTARAYGLNTLGAFTGAVATGFILLPWLGLQNTLNAAAALNLALGAAALTLEPQPTRQPEAPPEKIVPLVFALAGAAAMVYEVAWTRGLTLSLGSSTYAFTTILATFLAGLGLGSLLYPRKARPKAHHLGSLQLGIALLGAATIPMLGTLPHLFLKLFPLVKDDYAQVLFLDAGLAGLVLLPPTLLMGLGFPLATRLYADRIGDVYSANTLGCIVGAFAAGFLLIPTIGAQKTIQLAALLNVAAALPLLKTKVPAALLAVAVLALPPWQPAVMAAGVAIYPEDPLATPPAFYKDGLSSTVSVHLGGPYQMNLRVNGKIDASLTPGDRKTMYLTGYLPGLLHPGPEDVAVIGLGSGLTLDALANVPGVRRIDCAELEPAVIEAAKFWAPYNGNVLADPRVHLYQADGRTFLARDYDLIVSEPSNPWIAGVGNLFTQDFFALCKGHLKPRGLMAQWIHHYSMAERDLGMVIRTFFAVFPHGAVWMPNDGDLILLGSQDDVPFDLGRAERLWESSEVVARHFFDIGLYRPESLAGHYLCSRDEALKAVGEEGPLNTDDRPLLEFSAPFNLYRQGYPEELLQELGSHFAPGHEEVTPELALGWLNAGRTPRPLAELVAREVPESPGRALVIALAAAADGTPQAHRLFAQAQSRYPDDPLIAACRGAFEVRSESLREALRNPPRGGEGRLWYALGSAAVRTGDWEQAQIAMERATALLPESEPWSQLGYVELQRQQPEEALKALESALERNPFDRLAHLWRGRALEALGRPAEAAESYRRAQALDPGDPRARRTP